MKKVRAFHGTEVVNLGGAVTQCTKRTRRKRSPNKFRTTSPTTIFLPVTYPPTRCLIVSFFPLLQRSTIEGLFEGKVSSHFPAFFRFLGCQVTRTHTRAFVHISSNWSTIGIFLLGIQLFHELWLSMPAEIPVGVYIIIYKREIYLRRVTFAPLYIRGILNGKQRDSVIQPGSQVKVTFIYAPARKF